MKLEGGDAARFCRAPNPAVAGVLLHGPDEGLVAIRRRELVAAVLGAEAEPLRLSRLEGAAVRRDPASLDEALRSRGFFTGRAVVLVESATDALAPTLADVLLGATPDDAFVIVSAGALKGGSELRRLFTSARHLAALLVPAEAPTPEEIKAQLAEFGLRAGLEAEALMLLASLGQSLDRICFDRLLENVAIYSLGSAAPLTSDEIRLLSPAGLDAEVDAFVDAVANGRAEAVGPTLRRVVASGATAVTLLLGLQRHFRAMMMAAAGVSGGRMPVWGGRKGVALAQSRGWRVGKLELAARMLYEADSRIRSAERVPAIALVERCALRLAMMAETQGR